MAAGASGLIFLDIELRTSVLELRVLDFELQASDFGLRALSFGFWASGIGVRHLIELYMVNLTKPVRE